MSRLLLLGPLTDYTGNKSTLQRIKTFFEECLLRGLDDFQDPSDLNEFINVNYISCVISLHAYRSSRLLANGCSVPYAIIFGGTDVNVFTKNHIQKQLMTKTLSGAKAIISFSKSIESLANDTWPDIVSKKSFVIPQGVKCSVPTDETVVQRYDFMPGSLIFTLIAGLRVEKDPLYLLQAFQEWQDANGNKGVFVIIGAEIDKSYSDMFLNEIKKYPSVKFLGQLPQSEVFVILKHSFALINSSKNEGMSNVILEAMSLGVPVLARAIEGNKTLIMDGVNGFLYHSPEEFVSKAKCLLSQGKVREEIIINAQNYVSQHHNPEAEREKYLQLIKHLLS